MSEWLEDAKATGLILLLSVVAAVVVFVVSRVAGLPPEGV